MLLKDGYLNFLLHSKNVVKRGWAGRKIRLKKTDRVFFSISYLIRFPIVVQLLHSVQALPDSSDKLGPAKLFKLNDAQTGLASAKKKAGEINCITGVRLQNYGKPSQYRKYTSINVFSICYFF